MVTVIRDSWVLLLGFMLLMLGNGLQGTLLGVRGGMEGMSPGTLAYVISAFFLGLLIGARTAPLMIRRVGHVRVFAGLASLISAAFILYGALPVAWAWVMMRLLAGFCFSGIYIVVESWLNDRATNETRGQALSLYMVVQMIGVIAGQGLLTLADPADYTLFVVMSVLVSVALVPILLTASPAPAFQTSKPMTLPELFRISPLGCVATFLLGGVFSAMFGMAAVYGSLSGLSVPQISLLVALIYLGGLLFQYPVGWLSDRMDRRRLIVLVCAMGVGACTLAVLGKMAFGPIAPLLAVLLIGGSVNPLYSLAVAHTNDYLQPDDMASASAGLMFLNGVGAVGGPLAVGFLMGAIGAYAYFLFIGALLGLIMLYGLYRMTVRAAVPTEETNPFAAILPSASSVAMEITQEVVAELAAEQQAEAEQATADAMDAESAKSDAVPQRVA
jgi:MFS family permease